jgi:hypothetical protein
MPRLVRSDEFGPPVNSKIEVASKVQATHVGGTQTALVADEVWTSFSSDPRYVDYVGVNPNEAAWRADPRTKHIWEEADRRWQEYLRSRRIEPGDRVRVTGIMPNEPNPIPVGEEGTVRDIDSAGTIWCRWDSGRGLGLLPTDPFEKVI